MLVYPVAGRRVRCPVSKRPVPDEGLEVAEHDLFWARRLRDGDVSLEPPAAPDAEADAPAQPAAIKEGAE